MAEIRDDALLLRRVPFSDTSLICHFLSKEHGRITLMARGARRPKSSFRASLEPLYALQISWKPGRTGMGTLVDVQRGRCLLEPSLSLHGLELLAITSRLFQEGDPHGFDETGQALALLAERGEQQGLCAAVWYLLDVAGWLGNLSHCWHCDADAQQMMYWRQAQLLCESCGDNGRNGSKGMRVSAGLRKSIEAVLAGGNVRLHAADAACWRDMIRQALQEHGIKATDSFKV
ncbi:MAG: DNA repair protein RecO [Mariprofundus sp.]|nr:DNA repair protein RecO [Mariprofundus sp.]